MNWHADCVLLSPRRGTAKRRFPFRTFWEWGHAGRAPDEAVYPLGCCSPVVRCVESRGGVDDRDGIHRLRRLLLPGRFAHEMGSRAQHGELMAERVKAHLIEQLDNLGQLPLEDLLAKRYQRLMSYGN